MKIAAARSFVMSKVYLFRRRCLQTAVHRSIEELRLESHTLLAPGCSYCWHMLVREVGEAHSVLEAELAFRGRVLPLEQLELERDPGKLDIKNIQFKTSASFLKVELDKPRSAHCSRMFAGVSAVGHGVHRSEIQINMTVYIETVVHFVSIYKLTNRAVGSNEAVCAKTSGNTGSHFAHRSVQTRDRQTWVGAHWFRAA